MTTFSVAGLKKLPIQLKISMRKRGRGEGTNRWVWAIGNNDSHITDFKYPVKKN